MIQDYFTLLSARMKAEAELLLEFYRNHPGKLGEAREVILQSFFATYLPKSLSVGSGFTLTSESYLSTEQDIIIFDGLHNPVLFPNNRSAIYPHTAVRCLVEVKSTLGKAEIEDSVQKAQLVKQEWRKSPVAPLTQSAPWLEPLVCLFGFMGPDLATVKANLIAAQQNVPEEDRLDLICLLNSGVIASGTYFNIATFGQPGSVHAQGINDISKQQVATEYPDHTQCLRVGSNALLVFYYWMTSYIMRMPPLFPDLMKYAPAGMNWGTEC